MWVSNRREGNARGRRKKQGGGREWEQMCGCGCGWGCPTQLAGCNKIHTQSQAKPKKKTPPIKTCCCCCMLEACMVQDEERPTPQDGHRSLERSLLRLGMRARADVGVYETISVMMGFETSLSIRTYRGFRVYSDSEATLNQSVVKKPINRVWKKINVFEGQDRMRVRALRRHIHHRPAAIKLL